MGGTPLEPDLERGTPANEKAQIAPQQRTPLLCSDRPPKKEGASWQSPKACFQGLFELKHLI